MTKVFSPMAIRDLEDPKCLTYPSYIQRCLYGVRSFFKVDKFFFEKDIEIRSGNFLKRFQPTGELPGVIDGYFVYNGGVTPPSAQRAKYILQSPGASTEELQFIAFDLFIPYTKTNPVSYEKRLQILTDYISKCCIPGVTTTMSAVAQSLEDLEKYKDLFFSRPIGKGIFIRPSSSLYYPTEISKEVYRIVREV